MQRAARDMDWFFGLAQKKALITTANPGFWRRNEMSNLGRVYGYGGLELLSGQNLDLAKEILAARLDGKAGRRITLGPESRTASEWRKEMALHQGMGRSMSQDMSEAADTGGHWASEPLHKAGLSGPGVKGLPYKAARGYERGRDAVINVMRYPGEKLGKAGEHAWAGQLPEGYSFDDLLRTVVTIHDMKKGARLSAAAQNAKDLLIDYNAKSNAEYALGPLLPFITYWGRMGEGIAMTAAKNPRAYRRVHDFMALTERADAQKEGGAFDPRLKNEMDRYLMAPWVTVGGRTNAIRMESPMSEAVSQLGTLRGLLPGKQAMDPGRGPWSLLGPLVSELYQLATGKSLSSGQHVLGLSPSDVTNATPYGGMSVGLRNLLAAYKAGRLGTREQAAAKIALELGGGFASAPAMAMARYLLDSQSASTRTEEDRGNATARTAIRQGTGLGVQPVDVRAAMVRALADVVKSTKGAEQDRALRDIKRGRAHPFNLEQP